MTKKTTPKKSPDKKKSLAEARAKLAAGAKNIKAAAKSNGSKPRVVNNTPDGALPEIEECDLDAPALMKKRVKIDTLRSSLTLDDKTTPGEYVKIFDNFTDYGERFQFLIGDLILAGETLPSFEGKYVQAMLSTGRSLDSLKAYRSVALHTPPELRLLPYTHTRETVKIPKLEDRKAVIEEAAELAKEGKLPSVEEIRKKADKFKARKPKAKKTTAAELRDIITPEELAVLKELEESGSAFQRHLEISEFVHDVSDEHTAKLRDILKRLNGVHLRFAE